MRDRRRDEGVACYGRVDRCECYMFTVSGRCHAWLPRQFSGTGDPSITNAKLLNNLSIHFSLFSHVIISWLSPLQAALLTKLLYDRCRRFWVTFLDCAKLIRPLHRSCTGCATEARIGSGPSNGFGRRRMSFRVLWRIG